MFRAIISPILRRTRLCLQLVVQCTDDAAGWYSGQHWDHCCFPGSSVCNFRALVIIIIIIIIIVMMIIIIINCN